MVVGKHGIQTFEVVIVVLLLMLLLFDAMFLTSAHLLLLFNEWFVQLYLNASFAYLYEDHEVPLHGICLTNHINVICMSSKFKTFFDKVAISNTQ